ncbi:hypothetical protein ABEB36_011049 [Hypothenemus hampei]|uniref:THAP-type domain-containing protein n=1 Tax=Hypothenemus hampei TaxID=57062 RepID=A0ABD1EE15_HYPHA
MPFGRYCCVPNCKSAGGKKTEKPISMRALPISDPERYKIWIHRIGNPKLTACEELKAAYRKFRICDLHFSIHCFLMGEKRLMRDSLPSSFLPNFHDESTEKNSLFRHLRKEKTIISSPGPSNADQPTIIENSQSDDYPQNSRPGKGIVLKVFHYFSSNFF